MIVHPSQTNILLEIQCKKKWRQKVIKENGILYNTKSPQIGVPYMNIWSMSLSASYTYLNVFIYNPVSLSVFMNFLALSRPGKKQTPWTPWSSTFKKDLPLSLSFCPLNLAPWTKTNKKSKWLQFCSKFILTQLKQGDAGAQLRISVCWSDTVEFQQCPTPNQCQGSLSSTLEWRLLPINLHCSSSHNSAMFNRRKD